MYHDQSEKAMLSRPVAWDPDTKEACSYEVICHDCHTAEMEVMIGLKKKKKGRPWYRKTHEDLWINLWIISLYVNKPGMIIVIRIFMFSRESGVFMFKFTLWSTFQIQFGINQSILIWLHDRWMGMMRRLRG